MKRAHLILWVVLWVLAAGAARGIDVQYLELFKGQTFTQTGTTAPIPATNDPYIFETFAFALGYPTYYLGDVTDPVIVTPGEIDHSLTLTSQTNATGKSAGTNFVFIASAATQIALDTAYPQGTYTFSYKGQLDGATSVVVSLSADDFPPAAPFVSNLIAAQSIDPSSNFTLSFAPWASPGAECFMQLTVLDADSNLVFVTPSLFATYPQAPLSATNSSIVISNGLLKDGQVYTATLAFMAVTFNNVDDYTYPTIWSGFISETTFPLQTQGVIQTNAPPVTPISPANLIATVFNLTIASGAGPFASTGAYQIFTSATGSNYYVLGNAGGSLGSGSYVYTQTDTNTATVALTDAKAGAVSLLVTFDTGSAGTFVLTDSSGSQEGQFTLTTAYTAVNPPNIFLPRFVSNQFQAMLSGDPGVTYAVETSPDLKAWSTLTNLTIVNLATNIIDSPSSGPRFYRARVNSIGYAPPRIAGQSFNSTIVTGASPYTSKGIFQFDAATNGDDYVILSGTASTNGSGTYSYSVTGPSTAEIIYTDSYTSTTYYERLVFTSMASGYFYVTNAGSAGFQSGNFKMSAGPTLFLGNVKFTPDTARGASVLFPASGVPVSLSVTDVVGNIWSLSVPADALLTPATLSMTPFASGFDSSQSVFPIFTGVQLGPEGTQFADGVTLTLTTPSPLGAYATLLMGAGDGTGLLLVQTTNQGNNYSTTLFHFSSGSASNLTPQQQQDYINQLIKQGEAAYDEALAVVQNLTKQKATPPEPPDDPFLCAGNPAGDAQVDEYVSNLYSQESAAIANLLSAARALQILGNGSYTSDAFPSARQLVETVDFGKVNSLFNDWSGSPLKFNAVAKAALTIARQDQLLEGPGLPNVLTQLADWLSGNVLAYYWDQLRNQDDYTLAPVLLSIDRQIGLLGGSGAINPTAFIQNVASAYTFNATLTVSDVGDQQSIKAHGTVKISGNPQVIFPIGIGANYQNQLNDQFAYDSGTYANSTLQLPLTFTEGAVFSLDCTNTPVNVLIYTEMGAFKENWSNLSETQDYLIEDFSTAFDSSYGTESYGCFYSFPAQWQNLQAQPVNQTFTGSGENVPNDVVTFTITVVHDSSSAPQTLSP